MKFGYHTIRWGWDGEAPSFPTILAEMSLAGFKAFDTHDINIMPFINKFHFMPFLKKIGLFMPFPNRKQKFIHMLSQMKLVSIYSAGKFIPDAWGSPLYLLGKFFETSYFDKLIEIAASVGCERYILAGPEIRREIREKDYIELAGELNRIGKKCDNLNIKASYHPHLSTMVENKDQLAMLCRFIDPDLVHLTLETGHLALAGVDLFEVLDGFHERIDHVYFKDVRNGKFVELGEGTINFPLLLKKLKSYGYNGWIMIEDEVNSPTLPYAGSTARNPFETAKRSKKYVDTYLPRALA
jgi:inosose dehydratase